MTTETCKNIVLHSAKKKKKKILKYTLKFDFLFLFFQFSDIDRIPVCRAGGQTAGHRLPEGQGSHQKFSTKWWHVKISINVMLSVLTTYNSFKSPNSFVTSTIPTFWIRKLRQRVIKTLPKVAMPVDEQSESRQSGPRGHTLHNGGTHLWRVKTTGSLADALQWLPIKNLWIHHPRWLSENARVNSQSIAPTFPGEAGKQSKSISVVYLVTLIPTSWPEGGEMTFGWQKQWLYLGASASKSERNLSYRKRTKGKGWWSWSNSH